MLGIAGDRWGYPNEVKFLSSKVVPNVITHDKFWVDRMFGSRTPDSESCRLNAIDPYYTSGYRLSLISVFDLSESN